MSNKVYTNYGANSNNSLVTKAEKSSYQLQLSTYDGTSSQSVSPYMWRVPLRSSETTSKTSLNSVVNTGVTGTYTTILKPSDDGSSFSYKNVDTLLGSDVVLQNLFLWRQNGTSPSKSDLQSAFVGSKRVYVSFELEDATNVDEFISVNIRYGNVYPYQYKFSKVEGYSNRFSMDILGNNYSSSTFSSTSYVELLNSFGRSEYATLPVTHNLDLLNQSFTINLTNYVILVDPTEPKLVLDQWTLNSDKTQVEIPYLNGSPAKVTLTEKPDEDTYKSYSNLGFYSRGMLYKDTTSQNYYPGYYPADTSELNVGGQYSNFFKSSYLTSTDNNDKYYNLTNPTETSTQIYAMNLDWEKGEGLTCKKLYVSLEFKSNSMWSKDSSGNIVENNIPSFVGKVGDSTYFELTNTTDNIYKYSGVFDCNNTTGVIVLTVAPSWSKEYSGIDYTYVMDKLTIVSDPTETKEVLDNAIVTRDWVSVEATDPYERVSVKIPAIIKVRSGSSEQWSDESTEGKGALRLLEKGEIGWIVGTSDFKIGDGKTLFKDLNYIAPVPESVPYAVRVGDTLQSLSYSEIISKFNDLSDTVTSLDTKITNQGTRLSTLEGKVGYGLATYDSSATGSTDMIYVDLVSNDIYRWDATNGYVKMTNNFDVLQCTID